MQSFWHPFCKPIISGKVVELGSGRMAALAVAVSDVPHVDRSHSGCMTPIRAGQQSRARRRVAEHRSWGAVSMRSTAVRGSGSKRAGLAIASRTIANISRNVVPSGGLTRFRHYR